MRMIVGGAYQGKLAYALAETGFTTEQVADGATCPLELPSDTVLLNGLHRLVRRWMQADQNPLELAKQLANRCPDLVIVTDEIGCGVVPMDHEERAWREAVGRVCCLLAARSSRVDRVCCGVATLLKGEKQCKLC